MLFPRRSHRARRPSPTPHPGRVVDNPIATIERIGPTVVATLTVTALVRREGITGLMGLFQDVTRHGARHFVLDAQNLEFMDSACLGCLVKALNHAIADGGGIALANLEPDVQDLFRRTALDRRFPIYRDVPAALERVEGA